MIKLRQEKEDLQTELESARDNILYKMQTVWLPKAQESIKDLSALAGDKLTTGVHLCRAWLLTYVCVHAHVPVFCVMFGNKPSSDLLTLPANSCTT